MNASGRHDPVLLVRRGGERDGDCHLAPLPDGAQSVLVTLCGERIEFGTAELLSEPDGVPCVACLLAAPPSGPQSAG